MAPFQTTKSGTGSFALLRCVMPLKFVRALFFERPLFHAVTTTRVPLPLFCTRSLTR